MNAKIKDISIIMSKITEVSYRRKSTIEKAEKLIKENIFKDKYVGISEKRLADEIYKIEEMFLPSGSTLRTKNFDTIFIVFAKKWYLKRDLPLPWFRKKEDNSIIYLGDA